MARTALCIPCSLEFSSEEAYDAHIKSGHQTKGVKVGPPSSAQPLPEGVTAGALPDAELAAQIQRIEQEALTPITPLADHNKAADGSRLEIPPTKPIILTYVYTGECPTCRKPISTLELDVKKTHFVVAYCETCKKQLQEREEKNLNGSNDA